MLILSVCLCWCGSFPLSPAVVVTAPQHRRNSTDGFRIDAAPPPHHRTAVPPHRSIAAASQQHHFHTASLRSTTVRLHRWCRAAPPPLSALTINEHPTSSLAKGARI
jgi:hypothetical protein